jgi:hypothetical protein
MTCIKREPGTDIERIFELGSDSAVHRHLGNNPLPVKKLVRMSNIVVIFKAATFPG